MKKLVIVYVVLIIAVILLAVFKFGGKVPNISLFGGAQADVNGTKINLTVVKSDNDKQKGLSGRKSLDNNQGMLFVWDKKGIYPFWMKGMLFSIDIIYINDTNVVYVVENAAAPTGQAQILTVYKPDAAANYVLEVNAGTAERLKIKKGTKITFKGI